ncbi:MAG: amino acid hydroxylase [bacterium]|nr:amino acid hydroxylase [bacterium]
MKTRRPFVTFTQEAHETWRIMVQRQWEQAERYASRLWLDGLARLNITHDGIPDFAAMDQVLYDLVGWNLVSTDIQYSTDQDWFVAMNRREFLITEYIRDRQDIDYTPLPDIFHDAFGHLPFMADRQFADYCQRFGTIALEHPDSQRYSIKTMWWYTAEFGLIREHGELKALGAGLLSSKAELARAFDGSVKLLPFEINAFETIAASPHTYHEQFFVLESLDQLYEALDVWHAAHPIPENA